MTTITYLLKRLLQTGLVSISLLSCSHQTTIKNKAVPAERPMIWVSAKDKSAILNKIQKHDWAAELYQELKRRTEHSRPNTLADRKARMTAMPFEVADTDINQPHFPYLEKDDKEDRKIRQAIMGLLQEGIDCGVIYFLTDNTDYAKCAADSLSFFVEHAHPLLIKDLEETQAFVFASNHLLEARIFGAQVPIIYDFVYPFLKQGGQVYDIHADQLTTFNFDRAQDVFKRYIDLAIHTGIIDSNWPILEAPSLVHNTLALDDPAERARYLQYYLTIEGPHQDPLTKVAHEYQKPGDLWPESLNYSRGVTDLTSYLMTLLDRYDPTLKLGQKYPNVIHALAADKFIAYPNGEVPSYGDGHRRYGTDYHSYEMGLYNGKLNNKTDIIDKYESLIASGLAKGEYDKSKLAPRSGRASPYFVPLQLLWGQEIPAKPANSVTYNRTDTLPFAGMFIQRNLSPQQPVENSLMAVVMGAHHVHAHAGGMNLELYGKGHVLGLDPGKGKYKTDIHENYYRLFAAHNTVISNGASASKGGWVNLGVEPVELKHMEPKPAQTALSPDFSFSTTTFLDKHNLVAPAKHQRTIAVIRTGEQSGFYVDIARARSSANNEFHDYIYHNIGDKLTLAQQGQPIKLEDDPARYQANAELQWERNNRFRHPGWHFFKKVKSSQPSASTTEAVFQANLLGDTPVGMRAWYLPQNPQTFTTALAPKSINTSPPYDSKPTPTVIIRQQGEAWQRPFVAVYEPFFGEPGSTSVNSVAPLCPKAFCGLKVSTTTQGTQSHYYILINSDTGNISVPSLDITFDGHFGIVKLTEGKTQPTLYIGHGRVLQIGSHKLTTKSGEDTAYYK